MAQKLRGALSVRSRERALRRILFCALGLDCVLDLCVGGGELLLFRGCVMDDFVNCWICFAYCGLEGLHS